MIYINGYKHLPYKKVYLNNRIIYENYTNTNTEIEQYVRVDLNNQWELSELVYDSSYIGYQSFSNYNVDNSFSRMRIYIKGYDTYSFKFYSDGESCCDYILIGNVDYDASTLTSPPNAGSKYIYDTQNNTQKWFDANITLPDKEEHFIDVIYRKDGSVSNYTDRGYISLQLKILGEKWVASDTEYITEVQNGESFYFAKEYKYITTDNINWIQTNEYRNGNSISTSAIATDGFICENGTKYGRYEIYFVDFPIERPGIYEINYNNVIEENSEDCRFVKDFMFNYNFNDYNEITTTVPNYDGANWDWDLSLQGEVNVKNDGSNNYIEITNSNAYAYYDFGSSTENPFVRSGNDEFTVMFKVLGGTGADLISNRGSEGYNWMVRSYEFNAKLHLRSEVGSINYNDNVNPKVIAITFDGTTLNYYNLSDNLTSTHTSTWKNASELIVFFASMYSGAPNITEHWSGKCYWMFHSNRILTEEEMNVVADFNGR